MQIRFLLGPAGSGKTFRCLSEIRDALAVAPDGPPLVLLAPKQATFQLERQLLARGESPQARENSRRGERPREPRVAIEHDSPEGSPHPEQGSPGVPPHRGPVHGYTRLHILSFERLAHFLLRRFQRPSPRFLDEEGRVMVLRGLLAKKRNALKLFRASARLTGFARQLSGVLRELQRHQLSPQSLSQLAAAVPETEGLPLKLQDLATLLQHYLDWLGEHELQDADALLDVAAATLEENALRSVSEPAPPAPRGNRLEEQLGLFALPPLRHAASFQVEHLWLDGFAELSPQELNLLAALIPHCERATLAFCLDPAAPESVPWMSHWSVVSRTVRECRKRLNGLPGASVTVEPLAGDPLRNRFSSCPELAHLERTWADPTAFARHELRTTNGAPSGAGSPAETRNPNPETSLRLFSCANPEAEATLAAREILRFVRVGRRFREIAVLVRNLETYREPLQRVFARYEIPFFLDQRESVTHHPLAELTRSALRTVAFDWAHDDWFAALKTGLVPAEDAEIDRLENVALARGWKGAAWLQPLSTPDQPEQAGPLEAIRARILPPFQGLALKLAASQNQPTGPQLAQAVREFWRRLNVEPQLEQWTDAENSVAGLPASRSAHDTVWTQMNSWLNNVELAFSHEALALRDWLPILEAGLANLTIGLVPPALDQVLLGAVDRSRNPDLKGALVLGLNETVFPAAPDEPAILTDADCEELGRQGVPLHLTLRERAARERYYGYIACTRAGEQLTLTFSRHAADHQPLNPSPFIDRVRRAFPELSLEEFHPANHWNDVAHANELAPLLARTQIAKTPAPDLAPLLQLPAPSLLYRQLAHLRDPNPAERLPPAMAGALYGPVLRTSVSRLEEFAACPFRFFVHSGLRADERTVFELDARAQGTFQHDALKLFHENLAAENKHWRDLTPADARERMGKIAGALAAGFHQGLLRDSAQTRFMAAVLAQSLQDFIEIIVGWMRGQYEFDPVAVELEFGRDTGTPSGEIDLGEGHKLVLQGRIDRVDFCFPPGTDEALAVVVDYKSGHKRLDPALLQHGVQLQLPAYLNVLRRGPDPQSLGAKRLRPAGVFYVNLRGQPENVPSRTRALGRINEARKLAYRHTGRFDADALPQLDRIRARDQFNYRLKKNGQVHSDSVEALPRAEFERLLDHVDVLLAEMGRRIYAGDAAVDPYRKGRQTPCEYCDYRSVCRIDPWTHHYRTLGKIEEPDEPPPSAE